MTRGLVCAAVLGTVLFAGDGRGNELPATGEVHRSTVMLLGKPVPLPPGDWLVVGRGYGPVAGPSPGPYGAIGGIMLVQQRGGVVEGMILAHANVLPIELGWGPADDCRNVDAIYATGVRTRARNLACAYVVMSAASGPTVSRLPAWAAGRAETLARGLRLPGALAIAGVRVSDRRDVVDVRYAWAAEPARRADGKPRLQPAALGEPVTLRLRAQALAPWVAGAMTELANRIDDPLAPMADLPWPGSVSPASAAPAGSSRWQRRLGQAMSSRAVQASLSLGVGFIVTGSAYTAGLLAAWRNLIDGAGGHLVEFGWEWELPRPPMEFVADVGARAG